MKKGWFLHLCLFPFILLVCVAGCESSSMCFSEKLRMERILLLAVLPALLLAAPDVITNATPTKNVSVVPEMNKQPILHNTTPTASNQHPFQLTRIKISWEKGPCHGRMYLLVNSTMTQLCSSDILHKLGKELCEERRCGKFITINPDTEQPMRKGYNINYDLTVTTRECHIASISCTPNDVVPKPSPARKDNNELLAYKVITGLLLSLVLAILIFRFARPVYNAFCKRFSKNQQNRWIGPTQSQSVSYHRGGQLKPDTCKRQSYPGLELPSSNRNSEYDSYGYT